MGAIIALRIVHIGMGVFWAGGVLLMNFVVGPALTASGPDGIRVMQELHRRRHFDIILGAALVTILSGLDLVRRDSGGFDPSWFRSRFGMGISTGMLAAVIAFLIGWLAIRPAMRRMLTLGGEMAQAVPDARPMLMQQMGMARGRLVAFGSVATLFVIIAMVSMAVARYL